MDSQGTHVLIVGVDRYESRSLPRLRGARNDAVEWYRFCVRHLRVPAENIAVLASPPLTPRELGPEAEKSRLRGACREEMVEEAKRLAEAASSGGAGLLTFSGHGLALGPDPDGIAGADLALCPFDVTITKAQDGDYTISGALRFAEISEIFRSQSSRDNITVLLDTCYSDGPTSRLAHAVSEGDAPSAAVTRVKSSDAMSRARQILRVDSFTNRLILGAQHWRPAYEIHVGGQWRGAASFAFQTMMERWRSEVAEGARCLDVSYSDLMARARNLLDVLGVDQVPALWGARRLDELPVLRPGLKFVPGETSEEPNAARRRRQCPIDPEYPDEPVTYQFLDPSDNVVLQCVAMGGKDATDPSGQKWEANHEYWFLAATSYNAVLQATSLTMRGSDLTRSQLPPPGTTFEPSQAILKCKRNIGAGAWQSGAYSGGSEDATLFAATDPEAPTELMGLELRFGDGGATLNTVWFKSAVPTDGKAFEWNNQPSSFTNEFSVSTKVLGGGANYWYESRQG